MFESILSNIMIQRGFANFDLFNYVVDNNWLNFGKKMRKHGENIITCINNKRDIDEVKGE